MNDYWVQKYGDPRSPAQIKSLPREEMIRAARACCLLEHLSDSEIDAATVTQLRREIDSVVRFMDEWSWDGWS